MTEQITHSREECNEVWIFGNPSKLPQSITITFHNEVSESELLIVEYSGDGDDQ